MASKEDRELAEKLRRWFLSAVASPSWRNFQKNAMACFKYKEGDQWSAEEKAALRQRKQPDTVNNQVRVTIDRMLGQFSQVRTAVRFRPRNLTDSALADTLTDIFRFVAQQNELEHVERDVAEDGFTCGFGVFDVSVEFDELLVPQVKIVAEDPFSVYPDPLSRRYDWNEDALFVCRTKWVSLDEARERFPEHKTELAAALDVSHTSAGILGQVDSFTKKDRTIFFDTKRQLIRLVEVQYKIRSTRRMALTEIGLVPPENAPPDSKIIERTEDRINVAVFTGDILLSHVETDWKYFSLVPFFFYRKKDGEPYSSITTALSLQDAINKRESKALHLLVANQAIVEQGAAADLNRLAEELARPDGIIELLPGGFDKFRLEKNTELAAAQLRMHEEAKADFRRVTGVNPDALGEASQLRSGIGVARKVAQTELILLTPLNNFRRSRKLLARVVLDLIQKNFTQAQVFQITDDLNAVRVVHLGEDQIGAMRQAAFDVVVDEVPDLLTSADEQFSTLAQVLPQVLPLGPVWGRILLELAPNLPKKEELLKMVEIAGQTPPPPVEPRVSITARIEELTPAERAFFYERLGAPEIAEEVRRTGIPPAQLIRAQTRRSAAQERTDLETVKLAIAADRQTSQKVD